MTGVISQITNVWSQVMNWVTTSLSAVTKIFYTPEDGLTFLGTLAVIALGITVFFLLMGVIQNFLHLRG